MTIAAMVIANDADMFAMRSSPYTGFSRRSLHRLPVRPKGPSGQPAVRSVLAAARNFGSDRRPTGLVDNSLGPALLTSNGHGRNCRTGDMELIPVSELPTLCLDLGLSDYLAPVLDLESDLVGELLRG